MISKTFFSNKPEPNKAIEDLRNKVKEDLDFSPELGFFYSTLKYYDDFDLLLDGVNELINEIPLIGGTIDGAVFPHELRTDGCFLVLCKDEKANFDVIDTKKRGKEGFEELSKKIKKSNNQVSNVLLHYPLNFISNKRELISIIGRGKYYDFVSNRDSLSSYSEKFSDYLQDKGVFNPPNKVLKKLKENINAPIVGINLSHTEFKTGTPLIFSNDEIIRGGASCLLIKNKDTNIIYEDIYPEKPKKEIQLNKFVSDNFKSIKTLKLNFEGNVIYSINNNNPIEEVNNIIETMVMDEEKMIEGIENGKLQTEVPYIVFVKNKITNGVSLFGVSDIYPFDLFPTYLDLENFSNTSILGFEPLKGFNKFCSSLDHLKEPDERFTFSIFDISSIESFDISRIKYDKELKEKAKGNYFSLITLPPSLYLPKEHWKRNYLPEVEEDILFSGTGINVSVEI